MISSRRLAEGKRQESPIEDGRLLDYMELKEEGYAKMMAKKGDQSASQPIITQNSGEPEMK